MAEFTPRQKIFVSEYLVDHNATQAAIRAGYSPKGHGCELLKIPHVRAAVDAAEADREKRTLITADYVLTSLKEVAERSLQHRPVMVFDKEHQKMVQARDEHTGASLYAFDSRGANRALELLGRHLGIFNDKPVVQITTQEAALRELE